MSPTCPICIMAAQTPASFRSAPPGAVVQACLVMGWMLARAAKDHHLCAEHRDGKVRFQLTIDDVCDRAGLPKPSIIIPGR